MLRSRKQNRRLGVRSQKNKSRRNRNTNRSRNKKTIRKRKINTKKGQKGGNKRTKKMIGGDKGSPITFIFAYEGTLAGGLKLTEFKHMYATWDKMDHIREVKKLAKKYGGAYTNLSPKNYWHQ